MNTTYAKWLFPLIIGLITLLKASAAYPELMKTNFAVSVTSESMAAVWVASDRGFFRKNGLEMQLILMPRAPLSIAALTAGEIDLTITGPGHLLNAATGGAEVIGIANLSQKLDFTLSGRPEIKKPEDLRGKKIAISGPGATSHIVCLLALQKLGIDPNQAKISMITIPGTELNRRLALESGTVDATTLKGAMGDVYARKGYPVLFDFKGSGIVMPQTVILTTRRIAATRPQLLEAYLKSIIEGIAFVMEPANKEVVVKTLAAKLRLSKPSDAEESYQSVVQQYERVPYFNVEGLKKLNTILTTINPKLASVNPETVVDNSFITKLDSSGFIQSLYAKH